MKKLNETMPAHFITTMRALRAASTCMAFHLSYQYLSEEYNNQNRRKSTQLNIRMTSSFTRCADPPHSQYFKMMKSIGEWDTLPMA